MADRVRRSVVLLYGSLSLGGIETLIVRLAQALDELGCEVTILHSGGELAPALPTQVRSLSYTSWRDAGRVVADAISGTAVRAGSPEPTVVSFDPTSCALALWLIGRGALGRCKHLTGIYHPRAYFLEGEDRLREEINRLVFRVMPANALFFMNSECRETHASWSRLDLRPSPIIPLGIERTPTLWHLAEGNGDSLRIVSVGRLVGAKAYNLGAFPIVQELRDEGIDIRWDIYGSGELEPAMRRAAEAQGLNGSVQLRGDLPYAQFASTVAGYDVFIGIGTAALEAAMIGTPTMMATDSAELASYGFLYDLPPGNVGERQPLEPPLKFVHMLKDHLARSPAERIAIGQRCRDTAMTYDMHSYAKSLLDAGDAADRSARLPQYLASIVYRETTIGLTRKLANKAVRLLSRGGRATHPQQD